MMHIEYICHSCLYIDTGDTTLVFDPWFKEGAYMNQWQLFPGPIDTQILSGTKNILYSHGHDDHLHAASLKSLDPSAAVFFPYQWRNGAREFFREAGFGNITEAVSFKEYRITEKTSVTYMAFALESVIIVESNGIVLVNLNDALNSHHENVVQWFLREIKKRWPKIDYLFSGWSGAGYFPNTVHYKTKDDFETGLIREQYFAHNFCRIVNTLQPARALPFGPGFALLRPDKQWINEVKFPREKIVAYYEENFGKTVETEFFVMNPGDYFRQHVFHKVSPWHERFATNSVSQLIHQEFAKEIEMATHTSPCSIENQQEILELLRKCLADNALLYSGKVLEAANFSLWLENATAAYYNIHFVGNRFVVTLDDKPHPGHRLLLRTRCDLLKHALEHEWGGDVLTIGYGIDVDVYDEITLE
ncbi:MAG TPA: MBL fold metallo-hydrolase, partial [Bacteroidia bacterium]|nr:MBL fold metallo-hydrolase [Bacteroidia bacterium]